MYLYKCSCGSETLIASTGSMRCDCGGMPDLISGKHHPVLCGDLKRDLQSLAKLVYEASEMHGGVYISVARSESYEHSSATTDVGTEEVGEVFVTERYYAEPEIAACPFCGSQTAPKAFTQSEIDDTDSTPNNGPEYWQVCCNVRLGGCGAAGGYKPSKEQAISTWNGRAGK